MATSFIDLMSSPDPLNASVESSVPPSSRRVTRSQASQRFQSLGPSPRKQTFSLDVGNELSPQKILVTVEADGADVQGVNRRLFQSLTPKRAARRRGTTTTTTVPLKGLTDDEEGAIQIAATPKKRGRPPKSGTPTPGKTKRAATPGKKTPRQPRRTKAYQKDASSSEMTFDSPEITPRTNIRAGSILTIQSDHSTSELDGLAESTPKPRGRPARSSKRKTTTPAATEEEQSTLPKKRGRRRKEMDPDEILSMRARESPIDTIADDTVSLVPSESNLSVADGLPVDSGSNGTEDAIWMATLSDAPAPAAGRRRSPRNQAVDPQSEDRAANGAVPTSDDLWMTTLSDGLVPPRRRRSPRHHAEESMQSDISAKNVSGVNMGNMDDAELRSEASIDAAAVVAESEAESISDEVQPSEEKDTVMVGEEFTMISIGSLPSMQANLSAAAMEPQELGEATSLIINQTLESLRQSHDTPAHEVSNAATELDHTRGSEAVEEVGSIQYGSSMFAPASAQQPWLRSPRKAKQRSLGQQLALKAFQQGDVPETLQNLNTRTEPFNQPHEDSIVYEDSFSEIPEEVLEAATPKPRRQANKAASTIADDGSQSHSAERYAGPPSNAQSEASRLLTPDETPSPTSGDTKKSPGYGMESAVKSWILSDVQSSPPLAHLSRQSPGSLSQHSRHSSIETPLAQPSLPVPHPQSNAHDAQMLNRDANGSLHRPVLSPIVRAGRALQMVTSDPPSSPERESVLGSPFSGSVHQPSRSPSHAPVESGPVSPPVKVGQPSSTQRSVHSWSMAFAPFNSIRNLVVQGAQVFSPKTVSVPPLEDPFRSEAELPEHDDAQHSMFKLGKAVARRAPVFSVASSTRAAPPSDDAMSWQADGSPTRFYPGGRADSVSSTVRGMRGSFETLDVHTDRLDHPDLENDQRNDRPDEAEPLNDVEAAEEEDIWEVEAHRPIAGPAQSSPTDAPAHGASRRSKLPSPWLQKSKRLEPSVESKQPSNRDGASGYQDVEEFSMLSLLNRGMGTGSPERDLSKSTAPKRVDFSSFFSSPVAVPDVESHTLDAFEVPKVRGNGKNRARNIEQRSLPKRNDLMEDRQPEPQSPIEQEEAVDSARANVFQPSSELRADLFSPIKRNAAKGDDNDPHSSSPLTPERPVFAQVPQKNNFTPRFRQSGTSLFSFPAQVRTPTRSFSADPAEIYEESEIESEAENGHNSSYDSSSSLVQVHLKPLPDRAMTPSKSCIRSPMKPKTPGRVVEFTSSTLSPLAQAQARAERERATAAGEATQPNVLTGGYEDDKENQVDGAGKTQGETWRIRTSADPSSNPATPIGKRPAARQHLSQTQWTRSHWTRLDELLQQRRRGGALQFQLLHSQRVTLAQKNESAAPLLGKQVSAQGQTMALEQWHLDVVEAFRAEVGGWDETALAKRLFALTVGEERRRRGEVPLRR